MISKWERQDHTPGKFVRLPSDHEVDEGKMILMTNFFPFEEHGLKLKNGALISSLHYFDEIEDGHFSISTPKPDATNTPVVLASDVTDKYLYIRSLSEYIDWVNTCFRRTPGSNPIFRGHKRADFSISTTFDRFMTKKTPPTKAYASIGRNDKELDQNFWKEYLQDFKDFREITLRELLSEFVTLSPEHTSMFSALEWLVYARHSELHAPLIDFSRNPLVALYFALNHSPEGLDAEFDSTVYSAYLEKTTIASGFYQELEECAKGHARGRLIPPIEHSSSASFDIESIVGFALQLSLGYVLSPRSTSSAWLQKSVLVSIPVRDLETFYSYEFAHSHCMIRAEDKSSLMRELTMIGIDETSIYENPTALAKSIVQRMGIS